MKKIILSLCLAIWCAFPMFAQTSTLGSQDNPLTINNLDEFKAFRDAVNDNGAYKGVSMQQGNYSGGDGLYFVLTADIDMGGVQDADGTWGGATWTPIGTEEFPFRGNFNGKGHKISNLYINNPGSDYQGLFGNVRIGRSNYFSLDSIVVESGFIMGNQYVGGIVGYLYAHSSRNGLMNACYNGADVQGNYYVGGVVGYGFTNNTLQNCINLGNISGLEYIGGLLGYGENSLYVDRCYNIGTIIVSTNYAGGIVGYLRVGRVSNSINTGGLIALASDASYIGGIGGYIITARARNSISTGQITCSSNKLVGALIGSLYYTSSMSACYYDNQLISIAAIGSATGASDAVGQAEGRATEALLGMNTFVDIDNWNLVDGLYPIPKGLEQYQEAIVAATPVKLHSDDHATSISRAFSVGVDNNVQWTGKAGKLDIGAAGDVSLLDLGADTLVAGYNNIPVKEVILNIAVLAEPGSELNPLLISNEEELIAFRNAVNNPAQYTYKNVDMSDGGAGLQFMIANHITLTQPWTPIGTADKPFKGNLEGGDYVITGLKVNNAGQDNQGLFGVIEDAVVRNLHVRDAAVSGRNNVGGIAGRAINSQISDCSVAASVNGTENVGGIVGRADNSSLERLLTTGYQRGTTSVGGICGYAANTIVQKSLASGCITGTNAIGGIVGTSADNTQISYTTAYAFVSGNTAGGICGNADNTSVLTECVSGSTTAGNGLASTAATISKSYFDSKLCGTNGTNGKLTTNLIGSTLAGDLSTDHFVFTNGLYPIPKGLETKPIAIAAASPILITATTDNATNITQPINVCVDNNITWQSATGKIDIGSDGTTGLLQTGVDTLFAMADGNKYKWVVLTVAPGFDQPGTENNPLFIASKEELQQFRVAVNNSGTYKNALANNGFAGLHIALKSGTIDLSDAVWTPIGTSTNPFKGTFHGNGFEINGLKTDETKNYQGFFGYLDRATVESLHIGSGTVKGGECVAAICAVATSSTIKSCTNNATISGTKTIAGICAQSDANTTIQNCINTGFVKATANTSDNVGGIVGLNNGTVQYCMNAGLITESKGGGIAGTNSRTIKSCINVVPVAASVAAIVHTSTGTIQSCYYDQQMCTQAGTPAGNANIIALSTTELLGTSIFNDTNWVSREGLYPVPAGTETSNAAHAAAAPVLLNGAETVAGVRSIFNAAIENNVVWKGVTGCVDAGVDGNISLLQTGKDTLRATINDKVYKQIALEVTYVPTPGTQDNPLLISNLEEFRSFATAVNSGGEYKAVSFADGGKNVYVLLTSDIEMGPWTSIGTRSNPFKGHFNGALHKLTGINVNATTANQGLFGYVTDATLENISLNSGAVVGINYVGGIVGFARNTTIQNCTNGAAVQGSLDRIGGIAGYMYGGEMISCANIGEITAASAYNVGGVLGYMEESASVRYSLNSGSVWGNQFVGGLVGNVTNSSTLTYSINAGDVEGTTDVGAVYGKLGASTCTNCFADNQMCLVASADGMLKPTADLIGTSAFNDNTNWEQTAGLYPRPKAVAGTDVAIAAAMPILFAGTENADSVVTSVTFTSQLDVIWENTVVVPNFSFNSNDNTGRADCGTAINTATMTATKGTASRTIDLRILKAASDTVFYTDTVCQRITPNAYNSYGFQIANVRNLAVGDTVISRPGGQPNPVGCDSVYTLKLTVWPIDTVYYTASIRESSVYTKDGYTYKGTDLTLGDNQIIYEETPSTDKLTKDKVTAFHIRVLEDSLVTRCNNKFPYDFAYTYNGAAQTRTITLDEAAQPIDLLCQQTASYKDPAFGNATAVYDSILTVVHQINPAYVPARIDYDTICSGETYEWQGKTYTQTGIYTDSLLTAGCGCDSIIELRLTVNPSYYVQDYRDIKRRDMPLTYRDPNNVNAPVKFAADTTQSGIHLIPWQTALGCDSIVELHLTIAENAYDTLPPVIACGSYTWHGQTYYQSGTITHRVSEATTEGCDSIYVLNLTIQTSTTIEEQAQIALGDSYTWHGRSYSQTGIYEHIVSSEYGCDSIIYKLNLYVMPTQTMSESVVICESDLPYEFGDTIFQAGTVSGTYTNIYKQYDGDALPSRVTLQLTVNKGPEIGQIGQVGTVDINTPIILPTVPTVANSANLKYQRWEISGDNFATMEEYKGQAIDETYNGWQLRFAAENDCGVGYSNAVMVYVNGYEPPRIAKMWDDVIVCDNSENRYSQYQWYRDGEQIPGATNQYYVEPGGLSGSYYVSVYDSQLSIRRNSETLTFETATTTQKTVTIYPNPTMASEPMVMKLDGFSDEELQQSILYVYNVLGELVYETDNVAEQQELRLPAGQYVSSLLLGNGKRINTKVVVIK